MEIKDSLGLSGGEEEMAERRRSEAEESINEFKETGTINPISIRGE